VSVRFATRAELRRRFRNHVDAQLYDDSGFAARGAAICSLSDPRDIRRVRYVGQTSAPRRRFLQHLNTAMLWMPDEAPWWVKSRTSTAQCMDQATLPRRASSGGHGNYRMGGQCFSGQVTECARIYQCLERRLRLLNVETEILGRQVPLL
jgi:hypothetical protein